MPPQQTNQEDQGNHVYREEINRYAITGEMREGDDARQFVFKELPRQQVSRLDQRQHMMARGGYQLGTYPLNYEVRGDGHLSG